MEPSRDLASAGEFNRSESGWTTYIGSHIYNEIYNDDEQSVDIKEYGNNYKNGHGKVVVDDDDNDNDDVKAENNEDSNKDSGDEESDDSMASDASSGPSHLQLLCINSDRNPGLDYSTKHTENGHEKTLLAKRANKPVRKSRYEGKVEKEEEDSLLEADSATSHV